MQEIDFLGLNRVLSLVHQSRMEGGKIDSVIRNYLQAIATVVPIAIIIIMILGVSSCFQEVTPKKVLLEQLEPIPCGTVVDSGVAGAMLFYEKEALFVVGGSNFSKEKLSLGGKKQFSSEIYCYREAWVNDKDKNEDNWRIVGELPYPLAHAGYKEYKNGLVIVGGSSYVDTGRIGREILFLTTDSGKVTKNSAIISSIGVLPFSVNSEAIEIIDDKVYIIGGVVNGKASNMVYSFDLKSEKLDTVSIINGGVGIPNGFMQVLSAKEFLELDNGVDTLIFVIGGGVIFNGEVEFSSKIYCYDLSKKRWEKPVEINSVFFGSSILDFITEEENCKKKENIKNKKSEKSVLIIGGVDRSIFKESVRLSFKDIKKYLLQIEEPSSYFKFRQEILKVNLKTGEEEKLDNLSCGVAGAGVVQGDEAMFIVGGEQKPAKRTPLVYKVSFINK